MFLIFSLEYCWLLDHIKGEKKNKRSDMIYLGFNYYFTKTWVCRFFIATVADILFVQSKSFCSQHWFWNCMRTLPNIKIPDPTQLQISAYITLSLYSNKEEIVCSATGEVIRRKGGQKNLWFNSLPYFCTWRYWP